MTNPTLNRACIKPPIPNANYTNQENKSNASNPTCLPIHSYPTYSCIPILTQALIESTLPNAPHKLMQALNPRFTSPQAQMRVDPLCSSLPWPWARASFNGDHTHTNKACTQLERSRSIQLNIRLIYLQCYERMKRRIEQTH